MAHHHSLCGLRGFGHWHLHSLGLMPRLRRGLKPSVNHVGSSRGLAGRCTGWRRARDLASCRIDSPSGHWTGSWKSIGSLSCRRFLQPEAASTSSLATSNRQGPATGPVDTWLEPGTPSSPCSATLDNSLPAPFRTRASEQCTSIVIGSDIQVRTHRLGGYSSQFWRCPRRRHSARISGPRERLSVGCGWIHRVLRNSRGGAAERSGLARLRLRIAFGLLPGAIRGVVLVLHVIQMADPSARATGSHVAGTTVALRDPWHWPTCLS